ncbi:HAD family hydrolase [Endozoicomonadaceae bacterium StTr2]
MEPSLLHVMFDIDGTLVQSCEMDEACYIEAVADVLGHTLNPDWNSYQHVTDAGILDQHLKHSGLLAHRDDIHRQVKQQFTEKVRFQLERRPAVEIVGASAFLTRLRGIDNISLSIATGGWEQTARLKLQSAGIDITGIPLASSDDHFSRIEIMKIAARRSGAGASVHKTYFGDGSWDKQACQTLGYNFVLVGEKIAHSQQIPDYSQIETAVHFAGILNFATYQSAGESA